MCVVCVCLSLRLGWSALACVYICLSLCALNDARPRVSVFLFVCVRACLRECARLLARFMYLSFGGCTHMRAIVCVFVC